MEVKIDPFPTGYQSALTVTLDDLHPESSLDKEKLDFGASLLQAPNLPLLIAMKVWPELSITFFTVANWVDRSDFPSGWFFPLRKIYRKRRRYARDTFLFSKLEFDTWWKNITHAFGNNAEYAWHADIHHQPDARHPRSQEFVGLSRKEKKKRFENIQTLFKKRAIESVGFRPPGWFVDAEVLDVLREMGMQYIAGVADMKCRVLPTTKVSRSGLRDMPLYTAVRLVNGLWQFTANCFPHQSNRAGQIAEQHGHVIVHAHMAGTEFGLIHITHQFPVQMHKMLQEIHFRTGQKPWFATLAKATEFLEQQKHVSFAEKNDTLTVRNTSNAVLKDLTIRYKNCSFPVTLSAQSQVTLTNHFTTLPLISFVLTAYNGQSTIIEALDSLCRQTIANIEIIVVNDGSIDATAQLVEDYKRKTEDKRIVLINQKNSGRAANGSKLVSSIYPRSFWSIVKKVSTAL